MRLVVLGLSTSQPCGVRAYVDVLEPHLRSAGIDAHSVWWERNPQASARDDFAGCRAWLDRARDARADAALWHYSVFAYSRRSLPVLVAPVLRALPAPLVVLLHEYALTRAEHGRRGAVTAVPQLAALAAILRRARGAVVTTRPRVAALEASRALPRRPLTFLPVCSTIPGAEEATWTGSDGPFTVGVFGYGPAARGVDATVGGLRRLRDSGRDARLRLIGAPGPESAIGRRFSDAARSAGVPLDVTGLLAPADLLAALATSDVVLVPEPGPLSRRTTMASALAIGAPTVMFMGPADWTDPADAGAITLADRTPEGLAAALAPIADDPARGRALGAAARAFSAERQSAQVVAAGLAHVVRTVVA